MKKQYLTKAIALSTISASIIANLAMAQTDQRVIVTLHKQAMPTAQPVQVSAQALAQYKTQALRQQAYSVMGTSDVEALPSINAYVAHASDEQIAALKSNPSVATVERDPKRYLPAITPWAIEPQAETTPYGISMVQADQLSDSASGNSKVCIMDTGYTLGHPDLPNTGITGDDGYGSHNTGVWSNDGNGHGTHVAGTIAALGGNNTGVVGVNPSGQLGLHIVKVFNDQGSWAYGSDLIKAIEQCQQAGANITSMSLGGSGSSIAERNAFSQSYQSGMLHIAAAGNAGNSFLSYPASYDAVVSVAAVNSSESKASFSQYNSQVEIAGPGVNVNSTWNNNGYRSISGTSMATPHVSGVAALVWGQFPQCSAERIRQVLNTTAKDKGQAGRDTSYGYGIVQAKAAVDYLNANGCNGEPSVPIANFSYSTDGLTVSFTNQSSRGNYTWQFGDGTSSNQANPTHSYSAAGTYQVSLTVSDENNRSNTATQQITVSEQSGGCSGVANWDATTHYVVGDKVAYQGFEYSAIHWSRGAEPDVFSNVWRKGAACN